MNEELENAVKLVLADLEDRNIHTIGLMLENVYYGAQDPQKEELFYRTYEVAKNFLYSGNLEILGRK